MYKTALLLLCGPVRIAVESIGKYLSWTNKKVTERLYVRLEPELREPFTKSDTQALKRLSSVVPVVYSQASKICKDLDVRILLGSFEKSKVSYKKPFNFDAILTNCDDHNDINRYVECYFGNSCKEIINIDGIDTNNQELEICDSEFETYETVCVGGAFDRLHNGHKVLLSETVLKATANVIVGVSTGHPLERKVLWQMIEPVKKRIEHVTNFLLEIDPSLHYQVVPIVDNFGPTITNDDIDCLIVSTETRKGGDSVNYERFRRQMKELVLHEVNLVEDIYHNLDEDEKLSSSTIRKHLLGMPLKNVKPPKKSENRPYCVLLRGHMLSGKSFIASRFQASGVPVLRCDEILIAILNKDTDLKEKCIKEFSDVLRCDNGSLDYSKLMLICMNIEEKKNWLVQAILDKVKSSLQQVFQVYAKEGAHTVLITDLSFAEGCELGIEVDEIWAAVLTNSENLNRFKEHFKLSEGDDAFEFLNGLSKVQNYNETANIMFCTMWSSVETQEQINRAFSYLKSIQESS